MRFTQALLILLAAGTAAAFLYARSTAPPTASEVDPPASGDDSQASAAPVEPATTPTTTEPSSRSAPANGPARNEDAARAATARAEAKAARLVADETLTRDQIHTMLERLVSGKLSERELTPSDYERLVDAVLELRAAQRVLHGVDETDGGADVRARHMQAVRTAFAEIQDVLGAQPADLGEVLSDPKTARD